MFCRCLATTNRTQPTRSSVKPMILTPIDLSTRPISTPALDTTPAVGEKESTNPAAEFGAVMHALLVKNSVADPSTPVSGAAQDPLVTSEALTEQALADMLNLTPGLVSVGETLALTAYHLGPHLQVITPQTAAPEGQSLEVFARAQGLDEAALQWLMGKTSAILPSSTVATQPAAPTPIGAKDLASLGLMAPTPSTTGAPMTPGAPHASELVKSNPMSPEDSVQRSITSLKAQSAYDPMPGATPPLSAEDSVQLSITSLKPQSAYDPMKGATPWAAPTTTASDWLQGNALAVHLIKPPNSNKQDTPPTLLDLGTLLPAELQGSLESMAMDGFASGQESSPQGQGNFSGRPDANLVQRNESTAHSLAMTEHDSAQRRENISHLAEKMGQAVGERILSEIERGQWHLKLSLRPATLGHIEVEMRMRSGEMDAVFTASQALTRELLNEGMSKLKDTLNQMGMDVASLKVDDGQSRQRGGESTPERPAQLKDNAPTESADEPVSPTIAATHKMGADGWDVLV
jgi:flagellar hook-length control protein FliK